MDENASPDPPIAEALLRKRSISGPKFDVWYQEPFLSETTFDTCQMKLAKSSIAVAPFKPSKNGYMPVVCVREWEGAGTCVRVRLNVPPKIVCVCVNERKRERVWKRRRVGFFEEASIGKEWKQKLELEKKRSKEKEIHSNKKNFFFFSFSVVFCQMNFFRLQWIFSLPPSFLLFISKFWHQKGNQLKLGDAKK